MDTYFLRSGKMKSGRSPIEEIQITQLMITSYLFKRPQNTLYKMFQSKYWKQEYTIKQLTYLPFSGLKVTQQSRLLNFT